MPLPLLKAHERDSCRLRALPLAVNPAAAAVQTGPAPPLPGSPPYTGRTWAEAAVAAIASSLADDDDDDVVEIATPSGKKRLHE